MNELEVLENQLNFEFKRQFLSQKNSAYKKAWLEIMRDYPLAVAKIRTRAEGARLFAVNVMRRAMRYEVSEAVLAIGMKLARFHTFEGNYKQVEKYQRITDKYQKIVSIEVEVECYLTEVNKNIIKQVRSEKLLELLNGMVKRIDNVSAEVDSYSFLLHSMELKLRKYQLEENHEMILQTCREGLEVLLGKKFSPPPVVILMFTYPCIPIYIEQGEMEMARQAIEICYDHSRKKTNNWYVANSYDVILKFREGKYNEVDLLLNKVKDYPTALVQERYEMYKAYSALVGGKRFRVGKFINDTPEFSKDKQGYNISVIIVQLLHLLKNKSYDDFIDRIDATNQYIKRAVNAKQVMRSKFFLKILLLLPASNFHAVLFQAKSKKYLNKLKDLPIHQSSPSVEIELIPYEDLYEQIVLLLER